MRLVIILDNFFLNHEHTEESCQEGFGGKPEPKAAAYSSRLSNSAHLVPVVVEYVLCCICQRSKSFVIYAAIALPRRTRLVLSCVLFGTAAAGLYISDKLEEKVPAGDPANKKTKSH
ncbi:hypothetical protein A7U60_g3835 [Sanghuangporus baumii]|uniref:Uncharacterized protein n=1 Tax=Sanghuangporus baumii TaxID=108892 RepID=A0A9Q5N6A2_SANBA|nr:hypothetical protein A7U60_g3835 [Sanghuangporus baumii]